MKHFVSLLIASFILSNQLWAGSVILSWDASPSSDVTGYKIYWGLASRNYNTSTNVGNVLTVTLTNLPNGNTYFFAATAYDDIGTESDFSNEVFVTMSTNTPPNPPTVFSLTSSNSNPPSASFSWARSTSLGVTNYRVYYGLSSRNYRWTTNVGNNASATITGLTNGGNYYFTTTAMSTNGESSYSTEINYLVPARPLTPRNLRNASATNTLSYFFMKDSDVEALLEPSSESMHCAEPTIFLFKANGSLAVHTPGSMAGEYLVTTASQAVRSSSDKPLFRLLSLNKGTSFENKRVDVDQDGCTDLVLAKEPKADRGLNIVASLDD